MSYYNSDMKKTGEITRTVEVNAWAMITGCLKVEK
jgi:hypothetical protein